MYQQHQQENSMKITLAHMATVMALTVASTSAFAQSAEFRRGYDEGFAAGQRAAQGGPGPRPGWDRIHVEEAEYGVRGSKCDARQSVRNQIERNGGAVVANNNLCGDPARGAQKNLSIVYRCGDSEPVRVVAREEETLRLSCRR
jgi:hypothetical protein